ncbi:replication initiator protein A [Dorea sp. AM10-31]|uniref:replication initiator protein A n=1 Tax=Dorea sp. AM10-31 TaxID=2293098 RepID=UPI000E423AA2|nr:replication initiator protein A [Dorea sp. AM10-31]RGF22032.1 hypothetical protein DW125_10410 [Dorea sp. AM10-31]
MKYEYMKESEQMLQYFQFPKFLLKLRISQTAKFLYMILYDRARISRKNSWIDKYGNVYLIFPIEELSVQIDKCKSSVKTALKELDDAAPSKVTEKYKSNKYHEVNYCYGEGESL